MVKIAGRWELLTSADKCGKNPGMYSSMLPVTLKVEYYECYRSIVLVHHFCCEQYETG